MMKMRSLYTFEVFTGFSYAILMVANMQQIRLHTHTYTLTQRQPRGTHHGSSRTEYRSCQSWCPQPRLLAEEAVEPFHLQQHLPVGGKMLAGKAYMEQPRGRFGDHLDWGPLEHMNMCVASPSSRS